jgi:large subunit ribosomal protein L15
MKLHELHGPAGSRRDRKRIGRGISAGQGKTAGRGQKGAGARPGAKTPRGFEGGQMKITQRLPKLRGFVNHQRAEYAAVNVGKLNRFAGGSIVDGAALAARGLVGHPGDRVKLLAAGRVRVALTVRVHRASESARRAVEVAGGRVEVLEVAAEAPTLAVASRTSEPDQAVAEDPDA